MSKTKTRLDQVKRAANVEVEYQRRSEKGCALKVAVTAWGYGGFYKTSTCTKKKRKGGIKKNAKKRKSVFKRRFGPEIK
ncbi:MAG: hypothetical protein CMH98_13675 [Oceanospirillaceae bacterium]|nr:hypothetical protein [Oceanospirillaceae bacterium]